MSFIHLGTGGNEDYQHLEFQRKVIDGGQPSADSEVFESEHSGSTRGVSCLVKLIIKSL